MIQANELRIGNYITSKYSSISWQVMPSDIEIIFSNEQHYLPIPLTEEWLLKFGFFNIDENPIRYFLEHDGVIILAYDIDDCCVRVSDSWVFGKRKFVHEIQNLYFALTGEELTIKK